jgi:hypothetical protein
LDTLDFFWYLTVCSIPKAEGFDFFSCILLLETRKITKKIIALKINHSKLGQKQ